MTASQIEWAIAQGFADVPFDTAALADPYRAADAVEKAVAAAAAHLKAGRSVVVHSSRGGDDPRIAATAAALKTLADEATTAPRIGAALGRIVRDTVAQVSLRRVLIAGGDTSSYAARAMGIEAVEVIVPLAPGVPLLRAHAPGSAVDGLEVNFKGGQVGGTDYFDLVMQGRRVLCMGQV